MNEKLCSVFMEIKEYTDKLLLPYNEKYFLDDPSVEIDEIARKNDINDIKEIPKGDYGHAYLDLKNRIIYVNIEDSEVEKNFSKAHEFAHFILNRHTMAQNIIKRSSITNEITDFVSMKEKELMKSQSKNNHEIIGNITKFNSEKENHIAARLEIVDEIFFSEKSKKEISEKIAKSVYREIGKNVSEKKAFTFYEKKIDEIYQKHKVEFIKSQEGKIPPADYQKTLESINREIIAALKRQYKKPARKK